MMIIYLAIKEVNMVYAGFSKRFGAFWIDFIIFVPLIFFVMWGNEQWRLFELFYFAPGMVFGVYFSVYLVKRYGGTPGKLLLNIKIVKLDGSNVGYKESVIRYSVIFLLSVVSSIVDFPVLLEMSDSKYFSMGLNARWDYRISHQSQFSKYLTILTQIWIYSEFIVLLLNKKKRALHDYMAGTVVVEKYSLPINK